MKAIPPVLLAIVVAGVCDGALAAPVPGMEDLPVVVEGNHYDFFVADTVFYDSNIYRLPSNYSVATLVAPNASRSDVYDTGSVGLDSAWTLGQQAINFNAHVDDTRFDRNTSLDNVGGADNLVWNWRLGSLFSGQLGQDYTRALASFQETLYFGRDVVTYSDYYGTARYQVGPHWAVFGGVTYYKTTNTATSDVFALSNSNTKSGHGAIEYAIDVDQVFWVEYQYSDGSYPPGYTLDDVTFDRDYRENKISLYTRYALTEKTLVNANLGVLRRNYPYAAIGAFSGVVGRVSVQWQPTEKTQVVGAGWRELHAYLASASDYFVSTGVNLTPSWSPTEKITVSLVASYENQNYIPSGPSTLLLGSRDDKIKAVQLKFQYAPTRALTLSATIRQEERSSSAPSIDYNDQLANAHIAFKF